MNIRVNQLILEVTRWCNMHCNHCLRGNAQRLHMSVEVMDAVLNQISYMSSVTFTGGEPSLNIPIIEHFTDVIRNTHDMGPDSFYVVTNGKKNSRKLAMALIDLYDFCDAGNEMTGLAMSQDPFHEEVPIPNVFKVLKFFNEEGHKWDDADNLIDEGRAKTNRLGNREISVVPFENIDGYCDDEVYIEMLYIAANGNVISDCNFSYKRIDAESFGNILKTPLLDIIQQHTKVEERLAA